MAGAVCPLQAQGLVHSGNEGMYKCIFLKKGVSTHLFPELEEVPAMELFLKEINSSVENLHYWYYL